MSKFLSFEEAVSLIRDGDTIWINAFSALSSPVDLNAAITRRYRQQGHPCHLTVYSSFSFGDWQTPSDVEGYICEGAVDCIVGGFFGSMPNTAAAIMNNQVEGYNLPGGIMSHMIRAAAKGSTQLFSHIGLNLFVDPRIGQYRLNERSRRELVTLGEENGRAGLLYKIPKVDIALLKASYCDERGNVSFYDEGASIDALSVAQATHRNGGKVIVQVQRIERGHMLPRTVNIPAALVDVIVVCPQQKQLTGVDGYYDYISGRYVPVGNVLNACRDQMRSIIGQVSQRNALHRVIAQRAFREIQLGQIVNVGIGIPELIADEVLDRGLLDDVHLSVESGHTGGYPLGGKAFGAAIAPDTMMDMARQFDFYEGGGLDICFIGALQADRHGNVNGHFAKGKLSGIGGFANITQTTKKVVFCFTFSAKGLDGAVEDGSVHIRQEGSIIKLTEQVDALSFSAENARQLNQEILYITERCVFRLGSEGLVLTEIAPGIDLQRDILDKLCFTPEISPELKLMSF